MQNSAAGGAFRLMDGLKAALRQDATARAVHRSGPEIGCLGRAIQRTRSIALLAASALALACRPPSSEVVLVGTVERTLVEVSAPVSETIDEVAATRGQHVERGQLLVRLDPTLASADLAAAEATLAGARTGKLVAEQDWRRAMQLERQSVSSRQALDRAELARDQADALLRQSEAQLDASRKRLRDLTVVSPVSGVVDQLPFDPGERVPAGAVLVVVLADGAPWVRVWLPERALAGVAPGTPAEIRIDGLTEPCAGSVLDISREPEFTPHFALTERERGHLVYETRVALERDAQPPLRAGVPAEVTIHLLSPRLEAQR